jgi:hypothetical protein
VCVNSKAYPTNTCILEREYHLHPAIHPMTLSHADRNKPQGIAMLHLIVRLACRGTVTLLHFADDQGGEFSPHPHLALRILFVDALSYQPFNRTGNVDGRLRVLPDHGIEILPAQQMLSSLD